VHVQMAHIKNLDVIYVCINKLAVARSCQNLSKPWKGQAYKSGGNEM